MAAKKRTSTEVKVHKHASTKPDEVLIKSVASNFRSCSEPSCKVPALILSDPPACHLHCKDFEKWIENVEKEKEHLLATLAREHYLVMCEEIAPVSRIFYHKAAGEPAPNVHCRLSDVVSFMALASASGVIGNLAYDVVKHFVLRLVGRKQDPVFEARIGPELYERVRVEIHGAPANADLNVQLSVEREIALKYRLLVERRAGKRARKGRA
jgi:hypothetical protein